MTKESQRKGAILKNIWAFPKNLSIFLLIHTFLDYNLINFFLKVGETSESRKSQKGKSSELIVAFLTKMNWVLAVIKKTRDQTAPEEAPTDAKKSCKHTSSFPGLLLDFTQDDFPASRAIKLLRFWGSGFARFPDRLSGFEGCNKGFLK